MDFLDIVIIALVVGAAVHGARVGAVVQILTFVGFLAGLAIGAALVTAIDGHVAGEAAKTVVALVLLLLPAALLGGIGRRIGTRLWRTVRRVHFGMVDALAGTLVAIAGTLVVCWLFGSILVNSAIASVSNEIEHSRVLRGVAAVLPPVPNAFATVEHYLSENGFPEVFVNALPESVAPVSEPSTAVVGAAYAAEGPSTVKIVATGCGNTIQEGSGFAVGSDLVVTNAHVVAGTSDITIETPNGASLHATPVLFDPEFDLAVLRTAPLGIVPLHLDPGYVERGTEAVVLGYPEGGPLHANAAGVLSRFRAEGRDIYGRSLTERVVYSLQADVEPGNSGGPLVDTAGEVIGVVFSRSAATANLGYALSSPGVAERVGESESRTSAVSTQSCVS